MGRICDSSRACLESARTREVIRGVGEGGRSHITISTLNVGTLRERAGAFGEISDVVCAQETMITQSMTRSAKQDAASAGYQFYQGTPARVARDAMGRIGPSKAEGLGILCSERVSWWGLKKDLPQGCKHSRHLHSGWLACEDLTVIIHNLYLKTGQSEEVAEHNSSILRELVSRIEGIDYPHQLVMGDFQNRPADLMDLAGVLRSGWLSSCIVGSSAGVATNVPACGEERVLDAILISPALAARWVDFEVRQAWGFSSHKMVTGTFTLNVSAERSRRLAPPRTVPEDVRGMDPTWWDDACRVSREDEGKTAYDAFCGVLNDWLTVQGSRGRVLLAGFVSLRDPLKSRDSTREN